MWFIQYNRSFDRNSQLIRFIETYSIQYFRRIQTYGPYCMPQKPVQEWRNCKRDRRMFFFFSQWMTCSTFNMSFFWKSQNHIFSFIKNQGYKCWIETPKNIFYGWSCNKSWLQNSRVTYKNQAKNINPMCCL